MSTTDTLARNNPLLVRVTAGLPCEYARPLPVFVCHVTWPHTRHILQNVFAEYKNRRSFAGDVADGPLIDCSQSEAHVDQTQVCLRCQIGARPSVTSVYWIDGRPNDSNRYTVTRVSFTRLVHISMSTDRP